MSPKTDAQSGRLRARVHPSARSLVVVRNEGAPPYFMAIRNQEKTKKLMVYLVTEPNAEI